MGNVINRVVNQIVMSLKENSIQYFINSAATQVAALDRHALSLESSKIKESLISKTNSFLKTLKTKNDIHHIQALAVYFYKLYLDDKQAGNQYQKDLVKHTLYLILERRTDLAWNHGKSISDKAFEKNVQKRFELNGMTLPTLTDAISADTVSNNLTTSIGNYSVAPPLKHSEVIAFDENDSKRINVQHTIFKNTIRLLSSKKWHQGGLLYKQNRRLLFSTKKYLVAGQEHNKDLFSALVLIRRLGFYSDFKSIYDQWITNANTIKNDNDKNAQLIELLNKLYLIWDKINNTHKIYKDGVLVDFNEATKIALLKKLKKSIHHLAEATHQTKRITKNTDEDHKVTYTLNTEFENNHEIDDKKKKRRNIKTFFKYLGLFLAVIVALGSGAMTALFVAAFFAWPLIPVLLSIGIIGVLANIGTFRTPIIKFLKDLFLKGLFHDVKHWSRLKKGIFIATIAVCVVSAFATASLNIMGISALLGGMSTATLAVGFVFFAIAIPVYTAMLLMNIKNIMKSSAEYKQKFIEFFTDKNWTSLSSKEKILHIAKVVLKTAIAIIPFAVGLVITILMAGANFNSLTTLFVRFSNFFNHVATTNTAVSGTIKIVSLAITAVYAIPRFFFNTRSVINVALTAAKSAIHQARKESNRYALVDESYNLTLDEYNKLTQESIVPELLLIPIVTGNTFGNASIGGSGGAVKFLMTILNWIGHGAQIAGIGVKAFTSSLIGTMSGSIVTSSLMREVGSEEDGILIPQLGADIPHIPKVPKVVDKEEIKEEDTSETLEDTDTESSDVSPLKSIKAVKIAKPAHRKSLSDTSWKKSKKVSDADAMSKIGIYKIEAKDDTSESEEKLKDGKTTTSLSSSSTD